MSTTAIIVVVVAAVVLLAAAFVVVGLRGRRQAEARREEAARLREDAQRHQLRAERAEADAQRDAAEAKRAQAEAEEKVAIARAQSLRARDGLGVAADARDQAEKTAAHADDVDPDYDEDAGVPDESRGEPRDDDRQRAHANPGDRATLEGERGQRATGCRRADEPPISTSGVGTGREVTPAASRSAYDIGISAMLSSAAL